MFIRHDSISQRRWLCRRCSQTDHVFWTCDGRPHPGSQIEIQHKVNKTEINNDECTQQNVKEIEQNCKKPEFLNENDPSKFVEKDIMKSDFNNNVLNKLQSTNTSTESALLKINDKLDKIDKFESIFSKKIEYVMLEIKMWKSL